ECTDGHLSYFLYDPEIVEEDAFQSPAKKDLVIYELLLRDFLESHSFEDLIDTLSYLKRLGVNAIELMPIQEFEANDSWGYNPSYHMAIDKYYGSPSDFRRLVGEAHKNGIAVILDVVFNHAFGESPLVQLYWDQQLSRPSTESPYFNPVAKHPFNVGFDFNHESKATQAYVNQILKYWIEEFNIDGYRFDLSKGFTQRMSANNEEMSTYDGSRIAILKGYANYVWSIDTDQYVILEHFASNDEELELANAGMMLWGNGNYNFNEATMGYHEDGKSDFSWQSYKDRGWQSPNVVGYMESHDEERLMYKNLQFGNSNGSYNVKSVDVALKRNAMAAVFFFSIPGPKMLWQFGELGYDFSINRCTNGVVEDCRLDRKPIRWDYQNETLRQGLWKVYQKMIELKTQNPLFKTSDFKTEFGDPVKVIYLNSSEGNGVVIGNFDVVDHNLNIDFVKSGVWHDVFSSDSINVVNGTNDFELAPGEYHLFLDEKYASTSIADLRGLGATIILFPNPAQERIHIKIKGLDTTSVYVEIIDQVGRAIQKNLIGATEQYSVDIQDLMPGHYFVKITTPEGRSILPFIKT
ncbi:MAG: 1,4-alpha-glucan branching enzyme, partial [Saprospiraceae bacterium]